MPIPQDRHEEVKQIVEIASLHSIKMVQGLARIQERITNLQKNRLFAEAIILHSQAVEQVIKEILHVYKTKGSLLRILGENPFPNGELPEKWEEATLGSLIGILERARSNKKLNGLLTRFNKDFRVNFVHKAFFVDDEHLKKSEEEAKEYMRSKEFGEIVGMLAAEQRAIVMETQELYKK